MKNGKNEILFIDDDKDILEGVKIFLESEGFDTKTSDSAEFLKDPGNLKSMPDLILMDVLISGCDGRDITEILKKHPSTKDIPIILISAHPSVIKDPFVYGNDDFIEKPFDLYKLLSVINKNIKRGGTN
jgi:DNA-binding response OmpR family regulator